MPRVLYFANLRERAGAAEEKLIVPPHVRTGRHLLKWLSEARPELADILSNGRVRMALDQEVAALDAELGEAKEIALFPPMTGG